jgi:hypothetical protein
MALSTPNVNIVTDSFQNWIDKTNTLLDAYSTTIVTTAANSEGGTTTGNGTVNGIFTANSLTVNGNTTFGLRGGNTTVANVLYITSNVSIGNTSVNTVFTTTTIDTDLALTVLGATTLSNSLSVTGNTTLTGNATLSGTLQTISGNVNIDSGVLFVDAANNRVGINNTTPGVALRVTGDIDVSATANVQGNANVGGIFGVVGNTTLNGALQTIAGNVNFDTGTLFVDATNNRVGINNTAPGVALRVTGAADISLTANVQGAANVGGSLGVVGNTALTGNVTMSGALQTISGNVNIDSGVLFVDGTNNRVGINNTAPGVAFEVTGAANVSVSVNSALLTVGTSFIANTTGTYHTGVVNAASHTTSGFVANTSAIIPTSNNILLGNSTGRFVLSANTGDFSGNVVISGTANVTGNVVISGTANVTGNVVMSGTLQTISGNVNIDTGTVFIDATNNRLGVNTASPGVALDVVGSANISTSVNTALLTIGSSFIANTTGAYHTGVVNAASYTTSGFVANTTAIAPTSNNILLGNSTGRFILSASTGDFSGNVVISGTANVGSNLRVTGNVSINTFATFLTLANTDLGSNTTADRTVVSFPKASYQAGELLVYVTKGVEFQTTKILFVHNGTDVNQTVYGTVVAPPSSDELAANIALSVNSTNIDVTLRQRIANSTVKIIANMIS